MKNRTCLYCAKEKDSSEFSEEHIIPRFMGGSSVLKTFVTKDVCARCNSLFGRFVDAAVSRDYFMNSSEGGAWKYCFDFDRKSGNIFQLIFLGTNSEISYFENETVDVWLSPDAGTIWHVRKKDGLDFETFIGGDPVEARKDINSRVYLFFASDEPYWILSAMKSVKAHFKNCPIFLGTQADFESKLISPPKKGRICVKNAKQIYERDQIWKIVSASKPLGNRVSIDTLFDVRFLAKIGLGVGYVYFGRSFVNCFQANALRNVLWTKRKEMQIDKINVIMRPYYSGLNDHSMAKFAVPLGIVFLLAKIQSDFYFVIIFPSGRFAQVAITNAKEDGMLKPEKIDGNCIVTFPTIGEAIWPLQLHDFIFWKIIGGAPNKLSKILERLTPSELLPKRREA